jgi:hypothetical protein
METEMPGFSLIYFFFPVLGFELRAFTVNHSIALFVVGFFEIGS